MYMYYILCGTAQYIRRVELIRVKTNGKRALMLYHGPLFQGTKVIVITFYFDSTYSVQDMYTWPSEQSLN